MSRVIKEALAGFRRTRSMGFVSIGTTAASLAVFGALLLALANLYGLAIQTKHRVQLEIYLFDSAQEKQIQDLKRKLEARPEVKTVLYVDKETAAKEFREIFGEGLLEAVSDNPLPASLRVTMASGYRSSEKIGALVDAVKGDRAVEDVEYGRKWVEKLDRMTYVLSIAAVLLTLVIGAASIFVISNTVNLTILARRDSIEIMKLVGASNRFIRAPFIWEGIIGGGLGGGIAAALLYFSHSWLTLHFPLPSALFRAELAIFSLIPLGMVLGGLGSRMAVRRLLRHLS